MQSCFGSNSMVEFDSKIPKNFACPNVYIQNVALLQIQSGYVTWVFQMSALMKKHVKNILVKPQFYFLLGKKLMTNQKLNFSTFPVDLVEVIEKSFEKPRKKEALCVLPSFPLMTVTIYTLLYAFYLSSRLFLAYCLPTELFHHPS